MTTLLKIGQLLASLSILILLHEMGHFLFARLFKTRVEKFYLFFNPWFSIFKFKKGDTEYGIGWLPLGGYVKIAGMIDESMDKEQLKLPPQPYELRSKPTWQRLLIMLGGVTVNLILGFIIYSGILYVWGETYLPNKNMTHGVWVTDTLLNQSIGLQTGDKVISVNDVEPEQLGDIVLEIIHGGTMVVDRNGEILTLTIPHDFIGRLSDYKKKREGSVIRPRMPFVVASISDTSQNKNSGLEPKDKLVAIKDKSVLFYDQLAPVLDTMRGDTATFTFLRSGKEVKLNLTVNQYGKLNILAADLPDLGKLGYFQFVTKTYTFWQSIPAGFKFAEKQLSQYIRQFALIFDFKSGAHKGMGGFGAITSLFPPQWIWQSFWEITAILSLMLAFLNVLPIPALDGGHVMFLLYEMVTGRKPGDKFMEYAQIVGMVILLFLVVYANGNDIYRWILTLKGS